MTDNKILPNEVCSEPIAGRLKLDAETSCWLWQGTLTKDGHGQLSVNGINRMAHRIVYEEVKGSIPVGMVLDHRECSSNSCCNPDHLRLATTKQNHSHRVTLAKNNTTGYRNVVRIKSARNPFAVQIKKDGKVGHYGCFPTPEEANAFAIKKRKELFGEFAGLENPRKVDK